MDSERIEKLGVEHFYTHSYSPWERVSNENNNKLIRRGTDISKISKKKLREIEKWMNNY